MARKRLQFPFRGVGNASAFIKTPGDLAPPGSMRNVRTYDARKDRPRMGSRPPLGKAFAQRLGTGAIQAMLSVNRPSASSGLELDVSTPIAGTSSTPGILTAINWFVLDQVPSMERAALLDADVAVVAPEPQVIAAAFSQDGTQLILTANYTKGGFSKSRVRCVDVATWATVWTHEIEQASTHRFVNAVCCSAELVLVCTNQYLRVLKLSDGTQLGNDVGGSGATGPGNLYGWCQETIAVGTYTAGGVEYAQVVFAGSTAAGLRTGGLVEAGEAATHFRAGVMRLEIAPLSTLGPLPPGFNYLSIVTFGVQLPASDPFWEANHRYFRFSEQSAVKPHGCLPFAAHFFADGSIVVVRSNQGWGPEYTYRPSPTEVDPDGSTGFPFISACRISPAGQMVWENNTAVSVTDDGTGSGAYPGHPHFNDIYNPTFHAIGVDPEGNLYVGGRTNSSGLSLYSLTGGGVFRWARDLMSATSIVRAIVGDPASGNPVVVGDRNSSWDGAGGLDANVWFVDARDGAVTDSFDIGVAVSALCVAAAGGRIVFGTDYVP